MSTITTKSYMANGAFSSNWFIIDAENLVLGRLSTKISSLLTGKNKPEYTPHADTGDYIVVVNADKIRVTGNKQDQKQYYRHTGYPGGIKSRSFKEVMEVDPCFLLEKAVKGMLPRNKLGRQMFKKLKVYAGAEHPHAAQNPTKLEIY